MPSKKSNAGNINATKKSLEGKTNINSDIKINKLTFDGRQLKTAMNMYSYIVRERDNSDNN